jgi:thioredoxin-related protein
MSLKPKTGFACLIFLTLLFAGRAVAAQGVITGGVPYEPPAWFKQSFLEIAEDVAEANDGGKHVLLFFHLNACPYCEKMLRENFDQDPLKSQIQQYFDPIALNIKGDREIAMSDELSATERQLADILKIQFTPTIVFLNGENQQVLRLNGYRSPAAFEQALNFVRSKAYLDTTFSDYKRANMQYGRYQFIEDRLIVGSTDLSKQQGPVVLLFEDNDCNECEAFHRRLLSRPSIRDLLQRFSVIRLDAKSTSPLVGFNGEATSALQLASDLNITYRPGILLFDEGKEVGRVESMLYPFHFESVLMHALDNNYQRYPSYLDLGRQRQEKLLSQGIDVNLGKPADW